MTLLDYPILNTEMFIGDGSFGDCFQNSFQGIKVSIKVFKDKTERGKMRQ